eukprot:4879426-Pleurochrysis_carterae.AAC.1
MNFNPQGNSWYAGIVGHTTSSATYIGFDDGELRAMQHEEVTGQAELGLLLPLDAVFTGGLIDDSA